MGKFLLLLKTPCMVSLGHSTDCGLAGGSIFTHFAHKSTENTNSFYVQSTLQEHEGIWSSKQ